MFNNMKIVKHSLFLYKIFIITINKRILAYKRLKYSKYLCKNEHYLVE